MISLLDAWSNWKEVTAYKKICMYIYKYSFSDGMGKPEKRSYSQATAFSQ